MSDEFYCYVLSDPRTEEPFYVGKGKGKRSDVHLRGRSHSRHLRMKVQSLQDLGLSPQVCRIPAPSELASHQIERSLIQSIGRRDLGTGPLFNQTGGGEGSSGRVNFRHSEETKARIGLAQRGKPKTAEHRAKISASSKGRPGPSEAHRKLMSDARKRPEVKAKISEAARKALTPQRQSAMVAAAAAVTKGVALSGDHRAKIAASQKGRAPSLATRAKMSVAQRARYAK